MKNDVLEDARSRFKDKVNKAYRDAYDRLNKRVVGERVSLMYPYEEGKQEGPRIGEVQGTVESIEVGEIPEDNVNFTTFVKFEDGREFIDPESIEVHKPDPNPDLDILETDPQGGGREMTIHASYDQLVEAIGEPEDVSGVNSKVDVEWNVEDANSGRCLNVWNYKNGPNYLGADGTPPEDIQSWSAGGSEELAEELGLEVESRRY